MNGADHIASYPQHDHGPIRLTEDVRPVEDRIEPLGEPGVAQRKGFVATEGRLSWVELHLGVQFLHPLNGGDNGVDEHRNVICGVRAIEAHAHRAVEGIALDP